MVEYVFENKRLQLKTPVVAVVCKKHLQEDVKALLSKEDEKVALKYCRAKEVKAGDFVAFDTPDHKVVVGVVDSPKGDFTLTGGKIYRLIKNEENVAVCLPKEFKKEAAYEIALGIELGSYSFDKYITKRESKDFPKLERVCFKAKGKVLSAKEYVPYAALNVGVRYARDLTNEPANNLTPVMMAEDIKRLS